MHLRKDLLSDLIRSPEEAIEHLDLVYVDYRDFPIVRIKENDDFIYLLSDRPLTTKRDLERINGLVIPPAWEGVRITELANGHLQAVGRDKRKRLQYRYHPLWTKVRNQTKFYRMIRFGEKLPAIREQVNKDLERKGWPREKVLALVVRLMEETHIRIGNERYAKRNKTYGLSTLRSRHLKRQGNKIRIEFMGKRGKKHRVTLRNKQLVKLVNRCEEIPGWEVFKFFDEEGKKRDVDSGLVNAYIQELAGSHFSAKDFRTWGASILFFEFVIEEWPGWSAPAEKLVLRAIDHAATALGNTRKVCREYYVHPALPAAVMENTVEKAIEDAGTNHNKDNFTAAETAMLQLIRKYRPELPSL